MADVSEAAVGRLAKELAERDGFEWQMEFKPRPSLGTKIDLKPILDDVGREKYRDRARQQLGRDNA